MRSKKGFTLVELLVVMAIISILAAIAIPNVQRWILKSRATQAIAEISNIELAITKILSDAGRSSLSDLVDPGVLEFHYGAANTWTDTQFEAVKNWYTDVAYALLRKGRGALDTPADRGPETDPNRPGLLRADVVRNLGTSYMSELDFDPWGQLYQIYPGQWQSRMGTIIFRVYLPQTNTQVLPGDTLVAQNGDELTLRDISIDPTNGIDLIDPDTGEPLDLIGVPADTRREVYIWSKGANLISGQAKFGPDPTTLQYDPTLKTANYNTAQEPELMGGGDDINNWDKNQTFMRFYN